MTKQGGGRERNSIAFFCSLAWFGSNVNEAQSPDRSGRKDFWGVGGCARCEVLVCAKRGYS